MATKEKSRKTDTGKSQQESQAALERLKTLVKETETLADAFEEIFKKQGVSV